MTEIRNIEKTEGQASAPCTGSAWWLWPNHTFTKICLNGDWKKQTVECCKRDWGGSLFVRDKPDGKLIFTAHGEKDIEAFADSLDAFSPNDPIQGERSDRF